MTKTLYIAEKPDIGRAIAAFLWPNGDYKKESNCITHGDITVAWCAGHILRQAEPEAYAKEYAIWKNYPCIPSEWIMQPLKNSAMLLKTIQQKLKTADVVIHAGDPDREGQLLVQEVLEYCGYTGCVKRLLINAKDDISMKRAFDSIEDNSKYEALYQSGLARSEADWLIGMNLTRAYSVHAKRYNYKETMRIGRVQIPTLALVVRREQEIKNFHSKNFFVLSATYTKDNIPFKAIYVPNDSIPVDEEGRVLDENILKAIKEKVQNANPSVKSVNVKHQKKQPPLPHSLDSLQILANKKYNYSPSDVLNTCQSLYEKKYTTYPRSDCNYIPSSQHDDATRILTMLRNYGLPAAVTANPTLTSKAFNDSKVTAHHAIIPTGVEPENLNEMEAHIYQLIAEYYCMQFYPPYEFDQVQFTIKAADCLFKGSGKLPTVVSFMQILHERKDKDDEDNAVLPNLAIGDVLEKAGYEIKKKKTTPPKRFTEGTLLAAMTNIWRYVSPDNPNREKLKEVKGIGTPATRNDIIDKLESANSKGHKVMPYITKKGKELIPTELGCILINVVDPSLTYPDTTAVMEYELAKIAESKTPEQSRKNYLNAVITMMNENIKRAESVSFPPPPGEELIPCPYCKTGHLIQLYSPKTKRHFWCCSNKDCVSPITKKTVYYEDKDNKPVMAFCPADKTPLSKWNGKYGPFWKCSTCGATYNDKKGTPDFTPKKKKHN